MSNEAETKSMYDIEKLWGSKAFDKVMSYVDRGILKQKHGEKIARKLGERKVYSIFNASRSNNNNFKFDKDEMAKILENWYHTLKNEKEQKESLYKFRLILDEVDLNSLSLVLQNMSSEEYLNLEAENKELSEKVTSLEEKIHCFDKEKTKIQTQHEEETEKLRKENKDKME